MAKPIESTPTLRGKDAVRFIRNMIKEERYPNPKRVAFIKKALSMKFEVVNELDFPNILFKYLFEPHSS